MNKEFESLFNIDLWSSLDVKEQDKVVRKLARVLEKDFEYVSTSNYSSNSTIRIPTFRQIPSGVEMNLVVGGSFEMGFSGREEEQAHKIDTLLPFDARKMRPVHLEKVNPFLMGQFPILESFVIEHIEIDEDLFRPEFGDIGEKVPIYLTKQEINLLLDKFNLSIPSESQWEYAYRGGTNSLFYFGESFPDENTLENQILLYNFEDKLLNLKAANQFGFIGMQVGEWCSTIFTKDYNTQVDNDFDSRFPNVIRGGAASLYPWQDGTEWVLCISAMRRSSDELEDGTCGARFVKSIVDYIKE